MLLPNNAKQPSSKSSNPTTLILIKGISISYNTSSTTCKTKTKLESLDQSVSPIVNQTTDRTNQVLLNEVNRTNETQTLLHQRLKRDDSNDDEINSFLKVDDDDEVLSRQLAQIGTTVDGSGFSMFKIIVRF